MQKESKSQDKCDSPFRRATAAEEVKAAWIDPLDRTSYISQVSVNCLKRSWVIPEAAFLSEYSRNYRGWGLWDPK